jgi:DegT/DnrJ/EryC1/StrS aminotransferase family
VIVPSFTYVAAHQAITATGAEVVFVDIEEPTLTVNPDLLAEPISERTRAIMVRHFAGLVGRLDEIYRVAATHNLRQASATTSWGARVQLLPRRPPRRPVGHRPGGARGAHPALWSYMDDEVLDRVAGTIRELFAT